jgi:hypothetical protein
VTRYVGEPVIVVATWSSFRGRKGVVTQVTPFVMVQLEGEAFPLRMGAGEVVAEQSERHVGGAE